MSKARTTRAKKATTKKVATKKTSVKKAPAKKAVPKKAAAKKVAVKKTTRKKAATKKAVTKKVTTQKKTSKKTVAAKNERVGVFTAKKEDALAKLTTKSATKESPKEQRLLIPSPLRFPLDIDKLAAQTARYAGVFFTLLGALCTLWYSNSVFGFVPGAMTGATVDSTATTSQVTQTVQRFTDATETFTISSNDFLSGTVEISVPLEGEPISAYLTAKNLSTGVTIPHYAMVSGSNEWEVRFNTTEHQDGEYQFQVQAKYIDVNDETYAVMVTDTQMREILNDVADTTQTVQTVTTSATSPVTTSTQTSGSSNVADDTTTVVDDVLSGELSQPSESSLQGNVRLEVEAYNAERVKLVAVSLDGGTELVIGYAAENNPNEWRLDFDTETYTDGAYELYAVLVNGADNYETNRVSVDIMNSDTNSAAVQTVVADVTDTSIAAAVDPDVVVTVLDRQPLTGKATVNVEVDGANYVELFAQPKNTGTQRYLGLPSKVTAGLWTYTWDTTNVANGEYRLFAKVRTQYGVFMKEGDTVSVYNEIVTVTTDEELDRYETFEEIAADTGAISTFSEAVDLASGTPEDQLDELVAAVDDEQDLFEIDNYETIVVNYQADLDTIFKVYTTALRTGDQTEIDAARMRINDVLTEMDTVSASEETRVKIAAYAESKVTRALERIEADVERTNQIIAERTATEAKTDSDEDGITDYDEITIYKTDPMVADSDGDGFIDGAEVMSGYDPVNPDPEAAVAYESPKEVGVVREDVLAVHSITTEDFGDDVSPDKNPTAVITGRAFPNSFVTLYIFSTPVVVTVRTEADGSWVYRFDKELEDGEHQIYIGVTDNAGKIVAKSNPFTFVKEAQAYTAVDAPISGAIVANDDNDFLSTQRIIYLVVSIAVVAIGLVLIILGLRLEARPRKTVTELKGSEAT